MANNLQPMSPAIRANPVADSAEYNESQQVEAFLPTQKETSVAPLSGRKIFSLSTLSRASLDLCIAVKSLYFLIFAGLAFVLRGMPGPTIFPTMFAAIVGRVLKATAAFKLERGASIRSSKYLLGSRTVFSAIATLVELRTCRFIVLFLIVIWALSPIGSQASSRVVSAESRPTNLSATLQYLDVPSPFTMSGADEGAELGPAVRSVLSSALISSVSSKEAPEDAFSNIKIPMLEVFAGQGAILDDTWYDTSKPMGNSFSSILGLPLLGAASEGSSYFDLETS
ncbi:hypothetical protein LTR22_024680 [Elasticomyces elasticus]|nr:hypothetical protein LTR22_024680 [Elasticomyces elasticus]